MCSALVTPRARITSQNETSACSKGKVVLYNPLRLETIIVLVSSGRLCLTPRFYSDWATRFERLPIWPYGLCQRESKVSGLDKKHTTAQPIMSEMRLEPLNVCFTDRCLIQLSQRDSQRFRAACLCLYCTVLLNLPSVSPDEELELDLHLKPVARDLQRPLTWLSRIKVLIAVWSTAYWQSWWHLWRSCRQYMPPWMPPKPVLALTLLLMVL